MSSRSKRMIAKTALAVAQSTWLTVLGGYIVLRSQWVVLPSFIAIIVLMKLKCCRCQTPFADDRIYRSFKLGRFWDTRLVDHCPVCQRAMFEESPKSTPDG